jgi:hypothetical protein
MRCTFDINEMSLTTYIHYALYVGHKYCASACAFTCVRAGQFSEFDFSRMGFLLPLAMCAINLRVVYMRVMYPPPQNLPRAMHAINLSCAAFGAVCMYVCVYIHACVREWKGRYVNLCVVHECACVSVCICVYVLHMFLSLRQRWVDVWTRVCESNTENT